MFSLVFFANISLHSQVSSVSLSSESACIGDTILIPIDFDNLNNIGAISLFIAYDTNVLEFDTIINVNSLTPGVLSNAMPAQNGGLQVGLVWTAVFSGANIGTAHWLDLQFIYKNDSCNLSFNSGCEIGDYNANVLNVDFIDGFVNPNSLPFIINQPLDISVLENENASFNVFIDNANYYQWQIKLGSAWTNIINSGSYSGVNTSELQLYNIPLSLNNAKFRCYIEACNSIYSDSATLFVDTFTGVETDLFLNEFKLAQNVPNPFYENTLISYFLSERGNVRLIIFDLAGKIILQKELSDLENGLHEFNFARSNIKEGIYFYEVNFYTKDVSYSEIKKMLITK